MITIKPAHHEARVKTAASQDTMIERTIPRGISKNRSARTPS